jgi:hypothetical protein
MVYMHNFPLGTFSTSVFLALACAWVTDPRFIRQFRFGNGVRRGSCPLWFVAHEIKEVRGAYILNRSSAQLKAGTWHILHWIELHLVISTISPYDTDPESHIARRASQSIINSLVNTFRPGSENKSVNAVWGNNRSLFWDTYKTR